jgi:hypothetical protein
MPYEKENLEHYVAIWSKVVETQMHFNEMSVKARQFGLAFVAAALGLGVVLLSRGQEASIDIPYLGGFRLHATVCIALASAVALHAVKLLDLGVYHKMLRGAVAFGEDFEENYMKHVFGLNKGMTQAISFFSRNENAAVKADANGKYEYFEKMVVETTKLNWFQFVKNMPLKVVSAFRTKRRVTAEQKIRRCYAFTIWPLVGLAFALFLATSGVKFIDVFQSGFATDSVDFATNSSATVRKAVKQTNAP